MANLWELENILSEGFEIVCGVDEAGRGPLAGPVCAAAVILPKGLIIDGLNDSKKLTEKRREALFPIITESALYYGVGFASPEEIDEVNILNATYLAMNRAIEAMGVVPQLALIDGNRASGIVYNAKTVVGGDGKCASIAAASVIAKVSRDRLMYEYDKQYPEYGFGKHKGYGTAEHYAAIRGFGASPIHRLTFLKKMH